jgi:TrmH family RNA methyltransferase
LAEAPGVDLAQIRVVLVRPLQAGNVGAVARAMKNFGLSDLAVVAPRALDIDRARWMAPGAEDVLDQARYVADLGDAVADCHLVAATTARRRHDPAPAVDGPGFAARALDEPGRVAVCFGPEDHGLDTREIARAHVLVHLSTSAHASINVAQAVLLVASDLFREACTRGHQSPVRGTGRRGGPARGAAPAPSAEHRSAPAGAVEPLVAEWMESLALANYFTGHDPLLVEATVRRILQRAGLDAGEIPILRGMLRRMRWRMRHPGEDQSSTGSPV